MKSNRVMIFNGLILFILGLYVYLSGAPDKKSLTDLIGPAAGVIMILLSVPAGKGKVFAVVTAAVIAFFAVVFFFYTGFREDDKNIMICGAVSLVCFIFYVSVFIKKIDLNNERTE